MSAKKATQKSAKSTTAIDKTSKRFTDVTGAASPSAADLPRRAAELVAAQFATVAAAAEGM